MNDLLKLLTDTRQKLVMLSGQVDGVFVNKNFKKALANLDELTHLVVKNMNGSASAATPVANGQAAEVATDDSGEAL